MYSLYLTKPFFLSGIISFPDSRGIFDKDMEMSLDTYKAPKCASELK